MRVVQCVPRFAGVSRGRPPRLACLRPTVSPVRAADRSVRWRPQVVPLDRPLGRTAKPSTSASDSRPPDHVAGVSGHSLAPIRVVCTPRRHSSPAALTLVIKPGPRATTTENDPITGHGGEHLPLRLPAIRAVSLYGSQRSSTLWGNDTRETPSVQSFFQPPFGRSAQLDRSDRVTGVGLVLLDTTMTAPPPPTRVRDLIWESRESRVVATLGWPCSTPAVVRPHRGPVD